MSAKRDLLLWRKNREWTNLFGNKHCVEKIWTKSNIESEI